MRVTEEVRYQPNTRWGLSGQYNLSDYFGPAFEVGVDYVDGPDTPSGNLYKFTFAPQVTPTTDIMSRPALRVFVTYAMWDDSSKGYVAPQNRALETDGISVGMQVEAWW